MDYTLFDYSSPRRNSRFALLAAISAKIRGFIPIKELD